MKVLIVDDHPMVRRGLSSMLALEDNVEEIQETSNVEEAISILSNSNQEIAIVDLKLGKQDGLMLVDEAKRRNYNTKFIILTSSMMKEDFTRSQEHGVDGYILKEAMAEDILYAFHVVERGKRFFYPQILQSNNNESKEPDIEKLTEREKEVLNELGNGLSNDQIAQKLFISENTVKKHVSSILAKLGLNHRTQAALYINNSIKLSL